MLQIWKYKHSASWQFYCAWNMIRKQLAACSTECGCIEKSFFHLQMKLSRNATNKYSISIWKKKFFIAAPDTISANQHFYPTECSALPWDHTYTDANQNSEVRRNKYFTLKCDHLELRVLNWNYLLQLTIFAQCTW